MARELAGVTPGVGGRSRRQDAQVSRGRVSGRRRFASPNYRLRPANSPAACRSKSCCRPAHGCGFRVAPVLPRSAMCLPRWSVPHAEHLGTSASVSGLAADRHAKELRHSGGPGQESLQQDPLSGHLFVFRSKRGDRVKILYWNTHGYALWYTRLERGTFRFPTAAENATCLTISATDLAMLLDGVELASVTRRPRYRRPAQAAHDLFCRASCSRSLRR